MKKKLANGDGVGYDCRAMMNPALTTATFVALAPAPTTAAIAAPFIHLGTVDFTPDDGDKREAEWNDREDEWEGGEDSYLDSWWESRFESDYGVE